MPLTERVIETDKTHQRVEAEKGSRGVELCRGREAAEPSPALTRELALELVQELREGNPGLHRHLAAVERVGGAEAKLRLAEAAGLPAATRHVLTDELSQARRAWDQLPALSGTDAEALDGYGRLLSVLAREP